MSNASGLNLFALIVNFSYANKSTIRVTKFYKSLPLAFAKTKWIKTPD